MSKYTIIAVSKDDKFALTDEYIRQVRVHFGATDESIGDFDIINYANNNESLTAVYNRELNHYRTNKYDKDACDFLIFMHADVRVDLVSMLEHANSCKDKYDVMGLCGCSKIQVSQSPLNWFCGSRPYPNFRWGCVTHGELGNQTSFFSNHSPDVTDHEVACIDGLCIIFTRKALESGLTFDEQFKFDQYDTDISFQAIMKYNLKLGVIVEKSLQHYSVGKSILTADFLKHELDFRKKWNLDIPQELTSRLQALKV